MDQVIHIMGDCQESSEGFLKGGFYQHQLSALVGVITTSCCIVQCVL